MQLEPRRRIWGEQEGACVFADADARKSEAEHRTDRTAERARSSQRGRKLGRASVRLWGGLVG